MWRPIRASRPPPRRPSSKPSIPLSYSRANRQYGADANLAAALERLQRPGEEEEEEEDEESGRAERRLWWWVSGVCGASDAFKRKSRTLLRWLTERSQLRGTLGSRLRSSSANVDLFRVRPSTTPQNLSIPKCQFFFFNRRDLMWRRLKKKNRSDRKDSHTFNVRECVWMYTVNLFDGGIFLSCRDWMHTGTQRHTQRLDKSNMESRMKQMCHCIYLLNLITRDINKGSEGFRLKPVRPTLKVHVAIFFFFFFLCGF